MCVHVCESVRGNWVKVEKEQKRRKEDDWNHDKPGSGPCTEFLVHPAAILPTPQIPAVKWEAHLSKVLQMQTPWKTV